MKLINLERSNDSDISASVDEIKSPSSYFEKFPYGLSFTMETEELDKLGIDIKDYNAEDPISFSGKGFIKRAESSADSNGGDIRARKSLVVQITDLGIEAQDFESAFDEALNEK